MRTFAITDLLPSDTSFHKVFLIPYYKETRYVELFIIGLMTSFYKRIICSSTHLLTPRGSKAFSRFRLKDSGAR